jgi:RNA polymerase sigma-70 factor, ECF subfamily
MVAARIGPRLAARVDPSDVVQKALGDAARAMPEYLRDRPLPLSDCLRRFAWERLMKPHHHHIGIRRRSVARERRPLVLPDDTGHDLDDRLSASGPSPRRNRIREELIRRVRDAIATMSPDDQEIPATRRVGQLSIPPAAPCLLTPRPSTPRPSW